MKKSFLFINIIVNMGLFFFITGCSRDKASEYEFDYYPERNIYFNVQSSKFIYSLDGGKKWENYESNFNADPAILGRKEKIYSKSAEVWSENKSHLEMYEGKVFSVINEADRNFAATTDEVSDKQTASRSGSSSARKSAAPAKKKGVRGFFDRVFGKKKK